MLIWFGLVLGLYFSKQVLNDALDIDHFLLRIQDSSFKLLISRVRKVFSESKKGVPTLDVTSLTFRWTLRHDKMNRRSGKIKPCGTPLSGFIV